MTGRLITSIVLAFVLCTGTVPAAQAQVQAKSAFGESAVSAKYSDAQLSKFIQWSVHLASVEAQYENQPRMGGGVGKSYPGSAPRDIIDQKNQVLQDNKYFEMAKYLEANGTTVGGYQAMRRDISSDVVLKKRFRKMTRDMGYSSLNVDRDPFKDAPPNIGTY